MIAITTGGTIEAMAISDGKLPTSGTGMGRIPRVDIDHGNTSLQGLVFDKLGKLSERPGVVDVPLLLPNLRPVPYVGQLLHHDDISLSEAIHNPAGDNMVDVTNYPALPPGKPSQKLLGSSRAFGLESRTQRSKPPPYIHSVFAGKSKAIRACSKIVDSKVDSNGIRPGRSRNRLGKDNVNVEAFLPFGPAIYQDGRGGLLVLEEMPLVVSEDKRNFDPSPDGGEGDHFFGSYVSEDTLVVGDGSRLEILYSSKLPFGSFSNPCYGPYGEVGCKAELLLKIVVAEMLKLDLVGSLVLSGHLKDIVAGVCKGLHCCLQRLGLLWSWVELTRYCFDKLHSLASLGL